MASVMPGGVHWLKLAVAAFEPERNAVILDGCRVVKYQQLVLCPGLKLDWNGIEVCRTRWAATASPATIATTWRPIRGNWCSN